MPNVPKNQEKAAYLTKWRQTYRHLANEQKRTISFSKDGTISLTSRWKMIKGSGKITSKGVILPDRLQLDFSVSGDPFLKTDTLVFLLDMWVAYARLHGVHRLEIGESMFTPATRKADSCITPKEVAFLPACGFEKKKKTSNDLPAFVLNVENYLSAFPLFQKLDDLFWKENQLHPLLTYQLQPADSENALCHVFFHYSSFQGHVELQLKPAGKELRISAFYHGQHLVTGTEDELADRLLLFIGDVAKKQRIHNLFHPPSRHLSALFAKFVMPTHPPVQEQFAKEAMRYFLQKGVSYEEVELAAKTYPFLPVDLSDGLFYLEYTVPFLGHKLFFYTTERGAETLFQIFETDEELFAFYEGFFQKRLAEIKQIKQQAMQEMEQK